MKDRFKELARRLARSGSVLAATAGLTTCDFGAVDPAPPPISSCTQLDPVNNLDAIIVAADGQQVTLQVTAFGNTTLSWQGTPTVLDLVGASLDSVTTPQPNAARITLTLDSAQPTEPATFTLVGTLVTSDGLQCPMSRDLTVDATGDMITVSEVVGPAPLERRERATIAMVGRDGLVVELAAAGAAPGATLDWDVTAGRLEAIAPDRVRWHLPEDSPGLHQIELVTGYGDAGVAFDALALELT